jgi:uncharacterized protein YbbC (DUF1343 family)/CubicO group peptidase (beta-lactamase class C family)
MVLGRTVRLTPAARLIGLVAVFATAHAAPPQVDPRQLGFDPAKLAAIDAVVEQGIADGEMPGAVICVGRSGGIGFLRAYGRRQVEPAPEPMTTDTVFDMASLTKPVATATALMRLVQEGKVSPEDPVAKHLPEFGDNGKEAITVAQLLTHTSGLIPDNPLSDYEDGPEKAWQRIFALKPVTPPGTAFKYSDVNFLVLGKLVERLSGKPLGDYCREVTFAPLGMAETDYLPGDDLKRRAAPTEQQDGHWLKGEVHDPRAAKLGGIAGHAGLFSTATDMATYAAAMLHILKGERGASAPRAEEPLSRATAELMTAPRELPGGVRRTYGWDSKSGYSSNRGKNFSDRAFGHGGFTGTVMWIDPELDLYVIWLSNRLHPDGKGTVNSLAGKVGTIAAGALIASDEAHPLQGVGSGKSVSPVLTGIDVLKRDAFVPLTGRKVGLITNHTGRSREGESTAKLLADADDVELVALFSPEHGFEGKLDREGIADARDPVTGVKVYSLYGETRTPTAAMLDDLDTLVFDIQDIGARFYTYPSTMANAMKAAAEHGKRFVVLDRPNPINGVDVEGPVLDAGRESFVGFHPIAVRHGMTIGELATMYKEEQKLSLDLQVVKMEGWRRADYFDATALTWVDPSPNMRSLAEATLYPGIGLLETTNVSVGRGTDTPFEVLGAPWIDGVKLATALNERQLPGVRFVPVRFSPESSKFAGEDCGGVNILVTDRAAFRPVTTGLAIAVQLRHDFPDDWDTKSLDRLLTDKATFDAVLAGKSLEEIKTGYKQELAEFITSRRAYLLYE